jgi:hypothetical protein
MPNGYAPIELTLRGTRSSELADLEPGPIFPEWSAGFPAGIPLGRTLVVRGRMGAGKSRATFRLASQYDICAVLGLEMGKALSLETARNAGANLDSCYWYDDVDDLLADLDDLEPQAIAIDSIQKLGRARSRVVRQLRRWVAEHQSTLLLISQLSKDGRSRYGEDDDFDCDAMLDCLPGVVEGVRQTHSHGMDGVKSECEKGCCHIAIRKSRISPLIGFDVPIISEIKLQNS